MALEFHKGPSNEQLAYDLAVANRFTLEELELNRNGKIALRQFAILAWRSWKPMWTSTSAMLGWFLTLWVAHTLMPDSLEAWLLKRVWFWKLVGIAILGITVTTIGSFLAAFLRFGRRTFMLFFDLLRGDVQSIHGRVSPSWEEVPAAGLGKARGDKISIFKYCVKDHEFDVTAGAYNLLISKYDDYRPTVRLYYAPRSRMLLSLAPEEPKPQEAKQEDDKWVYRGLDGSAAPAKRIIGPPVPKQNDPDLTPLRKALGTSVKPVDLPPPPPPNRPMNVRRPTVPAAPVPAPATVAQQPAARPVQSPPGPPSGPPQGPPRQNGPRPPAAPPAGSAPRPPAPPSAPRPAGSPPPPPPTQPRRW